MSKHKRPGAYIPGESRERLFVYLRAAGFTLKETARLLRYTLRQAYDMHPRLNEQIEIEAAYLDFLNEIKTQWHEKQKEQRKPLR